MINISIAVDDAATPALRELVVKMAPGSALYLVMGRALANTLKAHFRALNLKGNKLGGKRTNFWTAVGSAVQNPVVASNEVSVAISHPAIRQKVYGGRIMPTKKKNLAIPVNALSHGKSPRVFQNLSFIPALKNGPNITTGYLVEGVLGVAKRGKKKGQQIVKPLEGGKLLYVLRAWVDQEADPDALPTDSRLLDAVEDAALDYLEV